MHILQTHKRKISGRAKTQRLRHKRKAKHGGEALAAGGYGCVFYPALKCITRSKRSNGISKLMLTKYADREMREVRKVKKIIKYIPQQEKYFLLHDTFVCSPDQLTAQDKNKFDNTCANLKKRGIGEDNVNKRLGELSIINIPYGGTELNDFIAKMDLKTNGEKMRDFHLINSLLIDLLLNAVVPMNRLGLLHNDIKDDNILMTYASAASEDGTFVRLIDWGLASTFNPSKPKVPSQVKGHSFAFNRPFSNILFQSEKLVYDVISPDWSYAAALQLFDQFEKQGSSHLNFIADSIKLIMDTANYKSVICEYIAAVLSAYHDENYTFQADQYFADVYSKNADIYGLLSCYVDFVEIIPDSDYQLALKTLLVKYCYSVSYATRPIPIKTLIKDLQQLS